MLIYGQNEKSGSSECQHQIYIYLIEEHNNLILCELFEPLMLETNCCLPLVAQQTRGRFPIYHKLQSRPSSSLSSALSYPSCHK